MGRDVVNADLARNAYGLVVVCVFTRCKACGLVLCGSKRRLGPEVDHNALEIELGELLVFVHQSSEVVGVGVRDDPCRDGDILVGLGVVLRLLAECLDDVCGVDAGVSVVATVNDDEAAVREAVDDAHTVLLIVTVVNALNADHGDLRGGNGRGIALLGGKRVLTEGLDDHADFLVTAVIRGVNGVFIGIENCKLVSDYLVCRIGLISYSRKLREISGVKLGGGILNDNAVASVAHVRDGGELTAVKGGQACGHSVALLYDIQLLDGDRENLGAVSLVGYGGADDRDQRGYRLGISRVGIGEYYDLVSDRLDSIFAVGKAVHYLCALGIIGRTEKDLECGAVVGCTVLEPVVDKLGIDVGYVIDDLSDLDSRFDGHIVGLEIGGANDAHV